MDKPLRRRFAPSYKLRVVEETDRCTEFGEVGRLLRREGLYSSHLTTWRKAARSGSLKARSKKRGRKRERNLLEEKVRKLERENTRLEKELHKAHLIIDVQGKVAGLLGLSLEDGTALMKATQELAKHVGVKPACTALRVSRATFYRRRSPTTGHQQPRPTPARVLSEKARDKIFDTLCSERFVDRAPAEVVATLLDEDVYLCSERTMYRVLDSREAVQERRAQRSHPRIQETRADGDGPEPGLVLGHPAAAGAEEVELLLPLRHPGHLQPLRPGMDGGGSGELRLGRPAYPTELPEAWRPAPGPDPALRSRGSDDEPMHGSVTRRSRRDPLVEPTPGLG